MIKTFDKTIRVVKDDLDDLNHVNNVRYVQWIQDISKEHWQSKAPKQLRDNIIWVVLNHNITYKSAAVLNDTIVIKTHIAGTKAAISTRIVEMFNEKTKELIVHSETKWCLLNSETLRPTRISTEIQDVFESGIQSST